MPRVRKMKGDGVGEDILRGITKLGRKAARVAAPIAREVVAIAAPIARDTLKRKLQQKADQYIESGKKGEGIGEDILRGLRKAGRTVVSVGRKAARVAAPIVSEAIEIATPIARDTFKRKLQQVADQYIESGKTGGSIRMNMSAAQARTLKKGGAIQVRPGMLSDLGRYAMELTPMSMANLTKKISNDRGMRLSLADIVKGMDMKRGGAMFELREEFRDPGEVKREVVGKTKRLFGLGKAPRTFEKGKMYTREVREGEMGPMPSLMGRGQGNKLALIGEMFRKKHGGKKGKGPVEDFFRKTIPKIVTQTIPRAIRDNVPKEVIRDVIDEAVPIASAAVGSTVGSIAGPAGSATLGFAGQVAGKRLAEKLKQKVGVGLYAAQRGRGLYAVGRGMNPIVIQTGSPYINHKSPAFHPFKEKVNPFT